MYSSRILLPQFVWPGACIVQSRWHTRASPALDRRRIVFAQKIASKIYHLVFVNGLIKENGTSWYYAYKSIWHLRSAIAFTNLVTTDIFVGTSQQVLNLTPQQQM